MFHFEYHIHATFLQRQIISHLAQQQHTQGKTPFRNTQYNLIHRKPKMQRLARLSYLPDRLPQVQRSKEISLRIIIVRDVPIQAFHDEVVIVVVEAHYERGKLAFDTHSWVVKGFVGFFVVGGVLDQVAAYGEVEVVC